MNALAMESDAATVQPAVEKKASPQKLVLVGNPNVGKSLFFNHFSGLYVDVSNYPGTTVEITEGNYKNFRVVDTPGIYGVSSFNDEERVARDEVLSADIVLNVVDAMNLERDLFLTLQLVDMQFRMVVALNMMDALEEAGMEIDVERLSEILGVPVVKATAIKKRGFDDLERALETAKVGNIEPDLQKDISAVMARLRPTANPAADALMILEGDEIVAARHGLEPQDRREEIYVARRNRVNEIVAEVLREKSQMKFGAIVSEKLGKWTISPLTGVPILIFALWLIYQVVGVMVAQRVVGHLEVELGNKRFEPFVKHLFAKITPVEIVVEVLNGDDVVETKSFSFPEGTSRAKEKFEEFEAFIEGKDVTQNFAFSQETLWGKAVTILAGEFGAFTMTVTYLAFLLLPLVMGFYAFLAVLEDCGYLPRLATMVDRLFSAMGLNGRAVIPIILGFGCVTMATITTRLLQTSREKTIAASILNFAIPCSAQLAVIAALLTKAGGFYSLVFFLVILANLVAIGTILDKLLPGKSSPLLIDLPPMRLPRPTNVLKKTWIKTKSFMMEAAPWFFVGALIVSTMQVTGLLEGWVRLFEPITTHWLHLPAESARAFVMGMVRRDFGAAGLYELPLAPEQIVVALTVITLFVPCIASLMALVKERGAKEAMIIWLGSWILAFGVGGAVALVMRNATQNF
ncbi:MAG: ferrous iron transporter B [Chloroherpetonaceae bacterium]|nr:ferrous iron transporter B [Chloroherpetonaceae bacterium]MDW8438802.1 ferrous iron transporter B [Chloroherpetonaceae bacterium]